jgi:hypothetical protein
MRCSHTILLLREVIERNKPGEEGHGLDKVDVIRSLREAVIAPIERSVRETAERILRDFNIPDSATFNQVDEAKSRLLSALSTLYLLSPMNWEKPEKWTPKFLLQSLEAYLRSSLQTSATTLGRALGQLPTLDRALAEVAAKCQNILALEFVLDTTKAPPHPLLQFHPAIASNITTTASTTGTSYQQKQQNLLQPLLAYLETGSLASYFWRSLAGSMVTRVQEISTRGGAVTRTLKANRANVGEAIRECVIKGSKLPKALSTSKHRKGVKAEEGKWEREIAVMVGSVVNNLGR